MSFILSVVVLFVLLVLVINAFQHRRSLQRKGTVTEYVGDVAPPATGREYQGAQYDWEVSNRNWEAQVDYAENKLEALKEKVEAIPKQPVAADSGGKDFSDIPDAQKKGKVMTYLQQKRGKKVKIRTSNNRVVVGEVVTLTANKVMLREKDKTTVTTVEFPDVVYITPLT